MTSTYQSPAVVSSEGIPVNQVYDASSGTFVAVAAGTVSTDANHNNQKSAPLQAVLAAGSVTVGDVQLVAGTAQIGHVIIDANNAPTYACSYIGLTPAASCTDLAILNGSASKIIRIMRIVVSALTSAATGATLDLVLAKRSTADTAGTAVGAVTPVPFDSADAAATAALTAYSANPTTGTLVGNVYVTKFQQALGTPTATDFPTNQPFIAQWGITDSKPIVLRSAAEGLAINFNGSSFGAGASVDVTVEWTELAA